MSAVRSPSSPATTSAHPPPAISTVANPAPVPAARTIQAPLQPADLEPCMGLFRLSRALHATVRLGLVPALARGPLAAAQVADACGTHPVATEALLDALVAWGVLARDAEDRYRINPVSRRLLPGEPGGANLALIDGWAGLDACFDAFTDLVHSIRTGECGLQRRHGCDFHAYLERNPAQNERYQTAMSSTLASFTALAATLDAAACDLIVDVGGGRGDFLATILARHPRPRGLCVDLPHVVDGLGPRCDGRLAFATADAFRHVPAGADLYLTSTVLRCFEDVDAVALLRSIRRAMTKPDARLVCYEIVVPAARDDPWGALAQLTARCVYGGRDRTEAEFRSLLSRAGLTVGTAPKADGAIHAITAGPAGEIGDPSAGAPADRSQPIRR
jgi:hypothetical protein